MELDSRENKYLRAKQQVADIKKFYTSLMFYVIFIGFLAGINYYTNKWEYMWFLWAAIGWGIGLVFQALKAYRWTPFMGRDWEDRKIKELMDKEDQFPSNNRWT